MKTEVDKLEDMRQDIIDFYKKDFSKWMDLKYQAMVKTPPKRKIVYRYTNEFKRIDVEFGVPFWKPVTPKGWNALGYGFLMNKDEKKQAEDSIKKNPFIRKKDEAEILSKFQKNYEKANRTIIVRDDDYIFSNGAAKEFIGYFEVTKSLKMYAGPLGIQIEGTDAKGVKHSRSDVVAPGRAYFDAGQFTFLKALGGGEVGEVMGLDKIGYATARSEIRTNIVIAEKDQEYGADISKIVTLNIDALCTEDEIEKEVAPVRKELSELLDKKDYKAARKKVRELLMITGGELTIVPKSLQLIVYDQHCRDAERFIACMETKPDFYNEEAMLSYGKAKKAVQFPAGFKFADFVSDNEKLLKEIKVRKYLGKVKSDYVLYSNSSLDKDIDKRIEELKLTYKFFKGLETANKLIDSRDKSKAKNILAGLLKDFPARAATVQPILDTVNADIAKYKQLIAEGLSKNNSGDTKAVEILFLEALSINYENNFKEALKKTVLANMIPYFDYLDNAGELYENLLDAAKGKKTNFDNLSNCAKQLMNLAKKNNFNEFSGIITDNMPYSMPKNAVKLADAIINYFPDKQGFIKKKDMILGAELISKFDVTIAPLTNKIETMKQFGSFP